MGFRTGLVALALVALLGRASFADDLALTGQNLTWDSITDPRFTIGMTNAAPVPSELFLGWQIGLKIEPGTGAKGSLLFKNASIDPTYLSNYILAGRAGPLLADGVGSSQTVTMSGTTTPTLSSDDSTFSGIVVPNSGKNLISFGFTGVPDAEGHLSGQFNISMLAHPDLGAAWIDGSFAVRQFTNAPFVYEPDPFGGPPIAVPTYYSIGTVAVPEPGTYIALASMAMMIAPWAIWRRRKKKAKAVASQRRARPVIE